VDHVHTHLGVLDLLQLRDGRLDRADDVALEDEVQVLDGTLLHLVEEALERDAALGLLSELRGAHSLAPQLGEMARLALVLDDAGLLSGRRWVVEAEDLDRFARSRLLDLLAAEVVQRAHLAPRVPGDDRVTNAERAALDEHRRDRPTPDVEA